MNISINFPLEIEANLLRRAAIDGKDVETLVREFVAERLGDESAPPPRVASHAEFMAKLNTIIELHPASNGSMDDSRESIYAGRGE